MVLLNQVIFVEIVLVKTNFLHTFLDEYGYLFLLVK